MRGYLPMNPEQPNQEPNFTGQQATIAELTQRKQELLYELTSYQNTKNTSVQVCAHDLGLVVISMQPGVRECTRKLASSPALALPPARGPACCQHRV